MHTFASLQSDKMGFSLCIAQMYMTFDNLHAH